MRPLRESSSPSLKWKESFGGSNFHLRAREGVPRCWAFMPGRNTVPRNAVEDVPAHEGPVLSRLHFDEWSKLYLDSDPESRGRDPAGVKMPAGPFSEIIRAWHGRLAYDPSNIRTPVAIIRGEWDNLMQDADACWLFDALVQSRIKRDIKISRGTHLLHLESMRLALWRESIDFLTGDDVAPVP